tara:strand:+ start:308 stop:502 length:195 start_codon:yes stop_codon:yes gene_type:complete
MTNQEIFYKAIEALDITEVQKIDIKLLAIEYAHREYLLGMNSAHNTAMKMFEDNTNFNKKLYDN